VKSVRLAIAGGAAAASVILLAGLLAFGWAGPAGARLAAGVGAAAVNLVCLGWIVGCASREARDREPGPPGRGLDREQLALAKAIVESSGDAIVSKDLDGIIRGWNGGAERILGYTAEEAIGRPISLIVPDDRAEEEAGIIDRIRRGARVDRLETVRRRKDGGLVDLLVTVTPVLDAKGRVVGASKIAREVTLQKRIERENLAALTELRDLRAAIDEHSIVAITDAAGRITFVNDRFCAISKYSREELLGQDHRIINSRHHPKEFFRDLWQTIGRGRVWRGEIMNRAKDGSYYWVDTTIFPRVNEAGKPLQYIAIRTDITRHKADQLELLRAAAELADKNRELETIVYTVSHDLRSPLVNVQGFSRQLERACERLRSAAGGGPVPAAELKQVVETTIPQAIRFIGAGVKKMDMLLAGLLRYSRMGRMVMTVAPLEMNALLAEILAAMRFQLNEAKADVQVGPLPACLGDSVNTSQVFANLIDNALKYRDPGRPPRIEVSGQVKDGQAVYAVSDNGIGIAQEHLRKVFEIFHRLNPDAQAGEGLGLTIAQRVLERESGKIWVESREGCGSTFFVSLPAVSQHAGAQP